MERTTVGFAFMDYAKRTRPIPRPSEIAEIAGTSEQGSVELLKAFGKEMLDWCHEQPDCFVLENLALYFSGRLPDFVRAVVAGGVTFEVQEDGSVKTQIAKL